MQNFISFASIGKKHQPLKSWDKFNGPPDIFVFRQVNYYIKIGKTISVTREYRVGVQRSSNPDFFRDHQVARSIDLYNKIVLARFSLPCYLTGVGTLCYSLLSSTTMEGAGTGDLSLSL